MGEYRERALTAYFNNPNAWPHTITEIKKHLADNPNCACDFWLPLTGGVTDPLELAPDCDCCSITTYWGSGGRYEQYHKHEPDIIAFFNVLRAKYNFGYDDVDGEETWIYLCACCWKRLIGELLTPSA